jgi:hypothetical protein
MIHPAWERRDRSDQRTLCETWTARHASADSFGQGPNAKSRSSESLPAQYGPSFIQLRWRIGHEHYRHCNGQHLVARDLFSCSRWLRFRWSSGSAASASCSDPTQGSFCSADGRCRSGAARGNCPDCNLRDHDRADSTHRRLICRLDQAPSAPVTMQIIDLSQENGLHHRLSAAIYPNHRQLWTKTQGKLDGTTKSFHPLSVILPGSKTPD